MTFEEALKTREENLHLIGKIYEGVPIDEIFIAPSKQEFFDSFREEFISSLNWEKAMLKYRNCDCTLYIWLNKSFIYSGLVFIRKLPENFDIK